VLEYYGLLIAFIPIIGGGIIILPFLWEEFREKRKRVSDRAPFIHKTPLAVLQRVRESIQQDNDYNNLRRLHQETGLSMAQLRQIRAEVNPLGQDR
jgi:hypothetical protein